MQLRSEPFDEGPLPDEDGRTAYAHTGTTYFVTVGRDEYVFSVDDETPDVAQLMVPTAWLIDDLRHGMLGRVIDFLGERSSVRQVALRNPLSPAAALLLELGTAWRDGKNW